VYTRVLFEGDSLSYQVGMKFSTREHDRDIMPERDCASSEKGGWWYKACSKCNLNGEYLDGQTKLTSGITWYTFKGFHYSLKFAEMKIRPYEEEE